MFVDAPGSVFISYHRSAPDVARWVSRVLMPLIVERLPHDGGIRGAPAVFRDERSIQPGQEWPRELRDALERAKVLIAVGTPEYFTRPWCQAEFFTMLDRRRRLRHDCILPIRFSDGDWYPPEAKALQWLDFERFYAVRSDKVAPLALRDGVREVCRDVRVRIDSAPADTEFRFIVPTSSPLSLLQKPQFPGDAP